MGQKLSAALCLLLMIFARGAHAEAAPPARTPTPSPVSDEESEQARKAQGDQVRLSEGETDLSKPGEVHTVVKGDTLWDLSQKYLGSPWYWPKVWSYNPEIANPHWIYPGNIVKFFGGGEGAPSRVEVGAAPEEMALPEESPKLSPAEMMGEEDNRVHVSGKISYTPRTSTRVARTGFLTQAEIESSGAIVDSFAQPLMLSFPDTVYIRFRQNIDPKVGARFSIYHVEREVRHPVLGERLGFITKVDGVVKVLGVERGVVTAQIQESYSDIRVGFLVGPEGEKITEALKLKPNDRQLGGYVVATLEPELLLLGEHHYIIVDKGAVDGVQVGNNFTVIRQGRGNFVFPYQDQRPDLPVESIGTCVATDVKQTASTCILTRSLREVSVGDRVVMRLPAAQERMSLR